MVIHYTKFEHFGIIRFWAAVKQTDLKILPTPTDIVGVGNKQVSTSTTDSWDMFHV